MYGHSLSCDYTITVERRMVVSLAFTQFNLEDSSRRSYDWLEVIDGPSQQNTSLLWSNIVEVLCLVTMEPSSHPGTVRVIILGANYLSSGTW